MSQTDLKSKDISDMECELKQLRSELRAEISDSLTQMQYEEGTEAWFENRDEKVLFYTGLPNLKILHILHGFLFAGLEKATRTKLTSFQELALTLMRLRLNLNVVDCCISVQNF